MSSEASAADSASLSLMRWSTSSATLACWARACFSPSTLSASVEARAAAWAWALAAASRATSRVCLAALYWSTTSKLLPLATVSICDLVTASLALSCSNTCSAASPGRVHVGLDRGLGHPTLELVDGGLRLVGLALGLVGVVLRGIGGALGVVGLGLGAPDVLVEGVERGVHLVAGGVQRVDLAGDLGLLLADLVPLGGRVGARGG